jgi:Sec-independent protein translocase protein TatA
MFGLSLGHLIVVAIVVLLFGSRRLPELGASLGHDDKGVKEPDAILNSEKKS